MRLDLFASQVSNNYYEHELFKLAHRHVEEHCVKNLNVNWYDYGSKTSSMRQNYGDIEDMEDIDTDISPEQILHQKREIPDNGSGTIEISIEHSKKKSHVWNWNKKEKNLLKDIMKPHPQLVHAICESSIAYARKLKLEQKRNVKVKWYIQAYIKCQKGMGDILFRCSPCLCNKEWYDWALFRDPSKPEQNLNGEGTFVGKILGFIKYVGKGSLTYKHVTIEGKTSEEIANIEDPTLYVLFMLRKTIRNTSILKTDSSRK